MPPLDLQGGIVLSTFIRAIIGTHTLFPMRSYSFDRKPIFLNSLGNPIKAYL